MSGQAHVTLTDVEGILVGHATDEVYGTGCTAVLCPEGFTPGVHVPGFAPGSRETELMRSENTVGEVHGLYFGGGSAFGLSGADGVIRRLREMGVGLVMPTVRIPLVPGAIIYDLDRNRRPGDLPDAAMGYRAASSATPDPVECGRCGAGTGARCGRLFSLLPRCSACGSSDSAASDTPHDYTSPGGVGSAGFRHNALVVAALAVVNSLGAIHDPETGEWLAGGVDRNGKRLPPDTMWHLLDTPLPEGNTVLVAVATNARLDKTAVNRVARMASVGLGRSVRPAQLSFDGDIVFALSKRGPSAVRADENLVGALAAAAVGRAIAIAVTS